MEHLKFATCIALSFICLNSITLCNGKDEAGKSLRLKKMSLYILIFFSIDTTNQYITLNKKSITDFLKTFSNFYLEENLNFDHEWDTTKYYSNEKFHCDICGRPPADEFGSDYDMHRYKRIVYGTNANKVIVIKPGIFDWILISFYSCLQDFYPWFVRVKSEFVCGGTLIAKNFILTAGHCLSHLDSIDDLTKVRFILFDDTKKPCIQILYTRLFICYSIDRR